MADDPYASIAKPIEDPYAAIARPVSAGALARFARSFNSAVGIPESVQDNPSEAIEGIKQSVLHPGLLAQSVGEMGKGVWTGMKETGQKAIDAWKGGHPLDAAGYAIESGIPVIGPAFARAGEQVASGDVAGGLGTAAGTVAPAAVAHPAVRAAAVDVARAVPAAARAINPRGILADKMAEVPPGEQFSRGEVLDAARAHDVNLDLAQATDSAAAKTVKKTNEYSLGGHSAYENNAQGNLSRLQEWADAEASQYGPQTSREVAGGKIQQSLKSHLEARKTLASNEFESLDRNLGGNGVDVTSTVQAEAQKIVSENKDYYSKHPELKPASAWKILEDLAKNPVEETAKPGQAGFTGAAAQPAKVAATKTMSWTELHQLRSDLMDFYRNNPDIVKGRGEAWVQRMVGTIDDAMTSASSGLTPNDLATFRHANEVWEGIKNTYDNPQSPFYHAVRAQYPSQVPGMLSKGTPELARQVRATLGDLQGEFQRQFLENMLTGGGETINWAKFVTQVKRAPQDHLASMLGEQGANNVRMLAKVAEKVKADSNPSGSGKVAQVAGEAGAVASGIVHGVMSGNPGEAAVAAAYPAGHWLTAKAMNSPAMVKWLTENPPPSRTAPPAAMRQWLNARQAQMRAAGIAAAGNASGETAQ